ncbi:MAG: serine aminopeptidase domain-containing protein [Arenicella sp.]
MKIVLLPGLDGTGNLFSSLINELPDHDCEVIPLPTTCSQDYPSITTAITEKLPTEDFILIAESFSGPIGATLVKKDIHNLKGIIFVATFLSTPQKLLVDIARHLPLKHLSRFPFSKYWIKLLFLGAHANNDLLNSFLRTIQSLPSKVIKDRLRAISFLSINKQESSFPCRYIQAKNDKLISPKKAIEFHSYFHNIVTKTIDGPHFILQAKPKESALMVSEFISHLQEKRHIQS